MQGFLKQTMANLHAILFCIYRLFPYDHTVKNRKKAFSPKTTQPSQKSEKAEDS